MSVELATAYVSLTVSAQGIGSEIQRQLGGPLEQAAKSSGTKSGAGFKSGFGGALSQLKSEASGASGFLGQMGETGSRVGGLLKQNLAAGAIAASAAVVALGVKAAAAFQDTALGAGKFADATGITVEQASRLREVAGDFDVSSESVQGALMRFNKGAEDLAPKLKELGAQLVYTKEGNVDAYESFINAASAIGGIEDPTKRAQSAQEVFGRSYGQIAELMSLDAGQLRAELGAVSEQKVINEDELARARDFRARLDSVKDIGEDLMLTLGELAVSIGGPLLTAFAGAAKKAGEFVGLITGFVNKPRGDNTAYTTFFTGIGTSARSNAELVAGFTGAVGAAYNSQSIGQTVGPAVKAFFTDLGMESASAELKVKALNETFGMLYDTDPAAFKSTIDSMIQLASGADEGSLKFQAWATEMGLTNGMLVELATKAGLLGETLPALGIDDLTTAMSGANGEAGPLSTSLDTAARKAGYLGDRVAYADQQIRILKSGIDADRQLLTLQGQFDDVRKKAEEAWTSAATGADNAEELNRDYQLSVLDLKSGVIDYATEVLKLPASQVTELAAAIDQNSIDGVESILTNAARPRTVKFNAIGDVMDFRVIPGVSSARALGGPTAPFASYLVGEKGPEILTMGAQSAYVTPAAQTSTILSTSFIPQPAGDFIVQNYRRDITVDELGRAVRMARLR